MTKEEALKILKDCRRRGFERNTYTVDEYHTARDMAIEALEQEPKIGHWEYGYAFPDGNYCKCSECKEIIKCIYPMHYCPNCGARMIESEDKE